MGKTVFLALEKAPGTVNDESSVLRGPWKSLSLSNGKEVKVNILCLTSDHNSSSKPED